jgi:2-dehydropantoate 2-reductase
MNDSRPKIGIVGAGAIGCALAVRLAKTGAEVRVFARGKTLAAIQEKGLSLRDLEGSHHAKVIASDSAQELGQQDWVFLCTKADALPKVSQSVQALIGTHTNIIPLINGLPWWYVEQYTQGHSLASLDRLKPLSCLSKRIPSSQVVGAVNYMTAHSPSLGHSEAMNPHELILGEINGEISPRLTQIASILNQAGINTQISDRIHQPLWGKAIANLTSNPLSAITGATLETIYSDPNLVSIVTELYFEARMIASKVGVDIVPTLQQLLELGRSKGAVKTSMLQDLEQNKPLEIMTIGDTIAELAHLNDIKTPCIDHILSITRFVSERPQHSPLHRASLHPSTLRSGL